MAATLVFYVRFTKEGLFYLQVSPDIKRLDLVSLTAPHTALHFSAH